MNDRLGLGHGLLGLTAALSSLVGACSTSAASSDAESQEQAAVSDIASMTARDDGTFDVKCRSGKTEIVSAADVQDGRVCKPAALPSSPFTPFACTGTPMTEAGARARLAAAGSSPANIGSYVLGLRRRDSTRTWNSNWRPNGGWDYAYHWVDAPRDALAAWLETGNGPGKQEAVFSSRGSVELAADATGAPYLRLVGEAANEVGADTTRFLRLVTRPLKPWTGPGYASVPRFTLESRQGDGPWAPVVEGWSSTFAGQLSVQTSESVLGGKHRQWHFEGREVTAIVTESCGQFVSEQSVAGLSPVDAAIGIAIALD